jgi:hypothetical protein
LRGEVDVEGDVLAMLRLRSFLGDVSLLDHLRQTYLQPYCAARPARTRAGSPGIMMRRRTST